MKKVKVMYGRIDRVENHVNAFLEAIENEGFRVISIQTLLGSEIDLYRVHVLVTIFYSN